MENGGIKPEGKVTTALDGSKNTAIAAAVNTGTPMSNKTPAMKDFLVMVSIIAMETPSPCVRSTNLLRGDNSGHGSACCWPKYRGEFEERLKKADGGNQAK
ncbi:hypothetical protein HanXRQr2_Chr01g0024571 [Helianthus annuus]|uniref:Uncharacterized protein n=1 Tax=Helianthus annuus TaxID=4232 RepID=A0A9K3P2G4_HELAN|nr:hypothetical protein HanXRQr2_Chr01g0024571 [Helianthus annuus]